MRKKIRKKMRKKKSKILVLLLTIAGVAVCVELFAGMVVLSNGNHIYGYILGEDQNVVVVGYPRGSVTIWKRYIERVISPKNLSEYGRHGFVLTDAELSGLGEKIISLPRQIVRPRRLAPPDSYRKVRHFLKEGGWEFSFKLPAGWKKLVKTNMLAFSAPDEEACACMCVVAVKTPPVDFKKQAELGTACARAELPGFSPVYSAIFGASESEIREHELFGTCGPPSKLKIVQIVQKRTNDYTFVVTFLVSAEFYKQYNSIFSDCRFASSLKRAGE